MRTTRRTTRTTADNLGTCERCGGRFPTRTSGMPDGHIYCGSQATCDANLQRRKVGLVTDDSRRCPACGAEALEFFVTLRRAVNPEANIIENRGPHRGRSFHVAADCQACGEIFEVKQ